MVVIGMKLITKNIHTSLYLCHPNNDQSQSIRWSRGPWYPTHVHYTLQGIVLIHPIQHLLTKRHTSMLLCLPSAVSGSTGNWTSLQIVQIYISELSILAENLFANKLIINRKRFFWRKNGDQNKYCGQKPHFYSPF